MYRQAEAEYAAFLRREAPAVREVQRLPAHVQRAIGIEEPPPADAASARGVRMRQIAGSLRLDNGSLTVDGNANHATRPSGSRSHDAKSRPDVGREMLAWPEP